MILQGSARARVLPEARKTGRLQQHGKTRDFGVLQFYVLRLVTEGDPRAAPQRDEHEPTNEERRQSLYIVSTTVSPKR